MMKLNRNRVLLNYLVTQCNRTYLTKSKEDLKPKCDAVVTTVNENDFPRACVLLNDLFFKDPLTKAFKIQQSDENELIMNELWLKKLRNNLSLKTHSSKLEDRNFTGISLNSILSQHQTYEDLKHFYETTESKELKNLFSTWARTIKKPFINEATARIFEISGIGIVEKELNRGYEEKLLEKSLEFAAKERYRYARIQSSSPTMTQLCAKMNFKLIWTTPFIRISGIKPSSCGQYDWLRIYQKELIARTPTPSSAEVLPADTTTNINSPAITTSTVPQFLPMPIKRNK